uniref:Gustatory receptor n=1 Tax=Strigamia maritima TaxID=126957 RepID=T1JJU6_STRMM
MFKTIHSAHKMMPTSYSPDYIAKCPPILKWLFFPFGLHVTLQHSKSTSKIMSKLSHALFIFHVVYHAVIFFYYLAALIVYLRRDETDHLHAVNNFSFILSLPISFITYVIFHTRQSGVSRVFNNLTSLPSSKMFSRKNWRLFIFGNIFTILLHVLFALTSLVLELTNEHLMEDYCDYMVFMAPDVCEDEEISRKVALAFTIIDIYEYSTTYFFITLCCVFFSLVCHLLALDLHQIYVELRGKVNSRSCLNSAEISDLRVKFLGANRMVKTVSHLLSPLVLLWLMYTLLTICTSIRTTITESFDGVHQLITPAIELIRFYLLYKNASSIRQENSCTKLALVNGLCIVLKLYNHFQFLLQSSNTGIAVSGLFVIDSHCVISAIIAIVAYTVIIFETR